MLNKTKELYFRCLDEGRSAEYFSKEVSKIWDNVDHRFMDKQIAKLQEMVHNNNVEQAINLGRFKNKQYLETLDWVYDDEFFKLTPESDFIAFEKRFKKNVITNYEVAINSIKNTDKEEYLLKKMDKYNNQVNQVVAYYHKGTDKLFRYVKLSSYLAMVHNTDLTRSAWNTTLNDASNLGREMFIIPFHPFSCLECYKYQNVPLTRYQVEQLFGVEARQQSGNILHPNCKCTLDIYWSPTQKSNEWKDYKEVDMETVNKKVEESFMTIMAGAFALAFSEENILAGLDGPNPDENGYYRYKITIDGLNEDTKAYASDFIWGTYKYEYDLNSTYYDSNSSYYIWVGRELSDEELSSMEDETEKYLKSIPAKDSFLITFNAFEIEVSSLIVLYKPKLSANSFSSAVIA